MSEVVVIEYVSLDGVIQAPGHRSEDSDGGFEHGGWTAGFMDEHSRYLSRAFRSAGGFLFGRKTYEIWAAYWPTVTDPDDEIAQALNTLPKYVASTTLSSPGWAGTSVIRDVPRDVARLRHEPGRPIIVMGSSKLAHTLGEHRLVDRYELWIHPVVLGTGKQLFPRGGPRRRLRLTDSRTTHGGLVALCYKPDSD